MIVGGLAGAGAGALLVRLLRRYAIPDSLENAVVLTVVVSAFGVANHLQSESGLLAVTVIGIVLGNVPRLRIKHVIEFKEDLCVLLVSSLFILLSARLQLSDFSAITGGAVAFVVALILLVRPIAVFVSTTRCGLSWRERAFLAWLAPRGIVAAAVASLFAIRLAEQGHPQASQLAPLTFLSIVATVAVYGLSAGHLARRLGLAESNPQGVLIIGAHRLGRAMGTILKEQGLHVLLVDSNWDHVTQARQAGLPASHGNILAEESLLELHLGGIGNLLAVTPNDEVNTLAAIHFADVFGRSNVYQLAVDSDSRHRTISHDLRGRTLFSKEMTAKRLNDHLAEGAEVRQSRISSEYSLDNFNETYDGRAIPLFIVDQDKNLAVVTADSSADPAPGDRIVFMA